jgi:hypothetical protein
MAKVMPVEAEGVSKHQVVSRYGGLSIRVHHFTHAGDQHRGHLHKIDHVTFLARGSVRVTFGHNLLPEEQEYRDYKAPALIEIDRDVYHQFEALEDDTMYACIFSEWGPVDEATGLPRQLDWREQASIQAGICDACSAGQFGCASGVTNIPKERVGA